MISILIPVYNYSIQKLVHDLHAQALRLPCAFEILIADDCSQTNFVEHNKGITSLSGVSFFELSTNVGRAKIRNYLAQQAQYPYLLYMDCDAEIMNDAFLAKYIDMCKGAVVVCGGTAYDTVQPQSEFLLRWRYGNQREQTLAELRNLRPNASFSTFNFLISKSILTHIPFNEGIREYGHEDTLLGFDLQKHAYTIFHINNQLIHKGLDENAVFVEKTKRAVEGLYNLLQNPKIDRAFFNDISLARIYNTICKYRLRKLVKLLYAISSKFIESWLHKGTAPMWIFDLYKLGYLCSLKYTK